jgi:hypothetical protein
LWWCPAGAGVIGDPADAIDGMTASVTIAGVTYAARLSTSRRVTVRFM